MARKPYVAMPERAPAAVVVSAPLVVEPAAVEPTPHVTETSSAALATAFAAPEVAAVASLESPAMADPVEEAAKEVQAPTAAMQQMGGKMRAMLEKTLVDTRASYVKAKTAADEASSAFEVRFATAKTGVAELNAKAIEALRASADANFDFMKSMLGVKSVSEYVTLHTEFARKQVEMMTGQTKEFSAIAKKVADLSSQPIKAQVAKTFKVAI
jgi:phasin family protein